MAALDEKQTVKVLFPCVHGLASGQLVTINCFPSKELKGSIKVVTGVDEDVARRIVGASRYGESDGRAGIGVMALFSSPYFSGESYGLALAVADKLARFGALEEWTEIYATGSIPADGCGRVAAISGFSEKLDLLLEHVVPGSLFLYPKDNLSPAADRIQEKLNTLQARGVQCDTVSVLHDLQGRVWPGNDQSVTRPVLRKITARAAAVEMPTWQAVFRLTLVIIGFVLAYLVFSAPEEDPQLQVVVVQEQPEEEAKKEILLSGSEKPHQEIKQVGRSVNKRSSTSLVPSGNSDSIIKGPDERNRDVVLESTDTDSSLY